MSKEKNVVRRSKQRRECWSWSEHCEPPWREDAHEPCTRMIERGERYVSSTIFPGHDSGYADGFYRAGEWVAGSPITSTFCLPCGRRWANMRDAVLASEATA